MQCQHKMEYKSASKSYIDLYFTICKLFSCDKYIDIVSPKRKDVIMKYHHYDYHFRGYYFRLSSG